MAAKKRGRPPGAKNLTPAQREAKKQGKPLPGRPTKLTPELQAEMVKLVELGNYMDTAAACCGVTRDTFHAWMKRGVREGKGPYYEFSDALKRAEGRAEAAALVRIRKAGQTSWQADAWYLERKMPRKWGRWDRVDMTEGKAAEKAHPERDSGVVVYVPDNGRLPKPDDD